MEFLIIILAAFLVAILTFFSGFGMGTILTPVFLLFFPIQIAIGMTAIVHLANNIFKVFLLGKHADRKILLKFGIPAVIGALIGAWLLVNLSVSRPLYSYILFGSSFNVEPVKLTIAIVLCFFSLYELIPKWRDQKFPERFIPAGGLLSGFFGGLSGNQGALRAAVLVKSGVNKESYVGTNAVLSCAVDLVRLAIYGTSISGVFQNEDLTLVAVAVVAAITGSVAGNRLFKKITFKQLQKIVAILLIITSIALGAGFI